MTEHEEQAAVINRWHAMQMQAEWLRRIKLAPFHNGGYRPPKTARMLKAEGTVPGMPDLILCATHEGDYTHEPSGALFIEMKRKGGKPTETQLAVHADLRYQGYQVEVCEGADAAIKVICDYLGIEEGS